MDEVTDIGSDISGTSYDSAMTNWGAPWQTPTKEQCEEMKNNCSSEWMSQNGVYGRKFTGSNGGTVFFPAAGSRPYYEPNSFGSYWTSTLYPKPCYAFRLSINTGDVYLAGDLRLYGNTIRPVCHN